MAWSDLWLCQYQKMNVILDPSYVNRNHLMFSREPADESPDPVFAFFVDKINAAFPAEHNVIKQIPIRVGHLFSRRYATRLFVSSFPWVETHG
ncbi:MAG: hypothetical protein WBD16_04175 [Pyrinomonadaceae bacterium]